MTDNTPAVTRTPSASDLLPEDLLHLTPEERINELNRRILNGETFSDDILRLAIRDLRASRGKAVEVKQKKVAAKKAEEAKGQDLLNNLFGGK